ncbi:transglutaminase domain-containing protein [Alteribacter keqinensis]|uniref:Transglutaminase domain-containing protein n=1 Tax=Alteribacter keqinensis TaxID=2483800 RepID=A0A3M7TMJ0_9BACI|nr:transglutaminase-like domain-containing protein [Alteribacter keqinensis]RNA66292.1 transglutaminase domain-containing protein [Alteribacter keqinensis]
MGYFQKKAWLLTASLVVLAGCSDEEEAATEELTHTGATEEETEEKEEETVLADEEIERLSAQAGVETKPQNLARYAGEIGLTLTSPVYQEYATNNKVKIEGHIEHTENLQSERMWLNIRYTGNKDLPYNNTMDHYIPIEADGSFSKEVLLHGGEGDHRVIVRAPSTTEGEENRYYDVTTLAVAKMSDELDREIETTASASEHELVIHQPETGLIEADGTFTISGELPLAEDDHSLIATVKGEGPGESEDLRIGIENGAFQSEIPLYFGEAWHEITLSVYNPEDELYYEAATIFVYNQSDEQFAEVEYFRDYFDRGVTLTYPTALKALTLSENTYRFAGEIDPDIPGADEIEQMIVTTEFEGEEEATYYLPVENYQFDGDVWLRFGEGKYEITVSVPDLEDEEENFFRYKGVARFKHQVTGVEDERSLLPSRGIESDHEDIQSLAQDLTKGLDSDREKAKAVYDYLTNNIAYDVEKFNERLFELDDSAVKTLELQKGVCQDYAFLGVALLRSIGMEANYVGGMATTGLMSRERHAWVEVKVDGEWIEMDPTWGAGYIDSETDEFVFRYSEDYFDPDEDFLSSTHSRQEIMY